MASMQCCCGHPYEMLAALRTAVALVSKSVCVQVLHVFSSVIKGKFATPQFIHGACAYLLDCMRARQFSPIDVAQAAHCLGVCRGGFNNNKTEGHGQLIAALVHEIEKASIELLQVGDLSPRQLSNVLWMFGRLRQQPQQFVFSQLAAQMITEQVCSLLCARRASHCA